MPNVSNRRIASLRAAVLGALIATLVAGSAFAQWTANGNDVYKTLTAGNVGIGTTTPAVKFHLHGPGVSPYFLISRPAIGADAAFVFRTNAETLTQWVFGITGGSHRFIIGAPDFAPASQRLVLEQNGNVGIGVTTPTAKLHVAGNATITGDVTVDGNIAAKYQDIAEWVKTSEVMEAGTVVVLDPEQVDGVRPASKAYDTSVAGVVSQQPGVLLGEPGDGKAKIATTGRVKVKVDATKHSIAIGDLLVTSGKTGLAMYSEPIDLEGVKIHRPGTIIGKAIEPLKSGEGEILVLLSLQ